MIKITRIFLQQSLQIYPNPFSSTINIHCSSCNNFKFTICNLQGQKIVSGNSDQGKINFSHLNRGVYFLKIQNGYLSKIIKE